MSRRGVGVFRVECKLLLRAGRDLGNLIADKLEDRHKHVDVLIQASCVLAASDGI